VAPSAVTPIVVGVGLLCFVQLAVSMTLIRP